MSNIKNIEIGLNEIVEYYPMITADYDLEFDDKTTRIFEVDENGKYQSEVEDLAVMFEILDKAFILGEHTDFYCPEFCLTNKENVEFTTLVINAEGNFPYDMFNRLIVIPAYYEGKYYKIVLDAPAVLERDEHLVMHKPVKYANLRKPRVRK